MPVVDAFNTDVFNTSSLTESINLAPVKPSRIGELGIFDAEPVVTQSVLVEEEHGTLSILPTVPRGGPATKAGADRRTGRSLLVPHIPLEDVIRPDEVQGIRAFGSESALRSVVTVVNNRLVKLRNRHEVTHEYHRIHALQGRILDADDSTIYNLFREFDVTEESTDFVLGTSTTDIRGKCLTVKRAIEAALGGGKYYDHIHVICGKTWFGSFISHALVKAAYERYADGDMLRRDPRAGFPFAGMIFEEYTDATVSGKTFMSATQARAFPVGVPGLFQDVMAPADFMETVNTLGRPFYAKQEALEFNRGIKVHTQSNRLFICTQPRVLHKCHTSN